jgi:hypothetical protein
VLNIYAVCIGQLSREGIIPLVDASPPCWGHSKGVKRTRTKESNRAMRSTQYQPASERTAQILQESAIVVRAIARHQREATLKGRTKEAHQMEALHSGVWEMALTFIRPYQLVSAAA